MNGFDGVDRHRMYVQHVQAAVVCGQRVGPPVDACVDGPSVALAGLRCLAVGVGGLRLSLHLVCLCMCATLLCGRSVADSGVAGDVPRDDWLEQVQCVRVVIMSTAKSRQQQHRCS